MASEVASLEIRVESDKVSVADKRLEGLATTGAKAERATDGLMRSFKGMIGPLIGMASAAGAVNKIIGEQQKYQKLTAQLAAVTGSVQAASDAYEVFDEIEGRTSISVDQLTDAFSTLTNAGLDPSKEALEAYANIAAATGTDITTVVDAIRQSSFGMQRGLQQIGVKVKEDGNNLKVTFRGVTTSIKNDSAAIEQYMQNLGDKTFAGAAEAQANVFLKIKDAWDDLWLHIGQAGATNVITDALEGALGALRELDAMIRSGQLNAYLSALGAQFKGWKDDVVDTVDIVSNVWDDLMRSLGDDTKTVITEIIDGFKYMGANIRGLIQLTVVATASFFDEVLQHARSYVEGIKAVFTDDTLEKVGQRLQDRLAAIQYARESSYQSIYDERQAAINATNAEIAKAKELRKAYDNAAAPKLKGKRSGKIVGDGNEAAIKKEREEFKRMVESFLTDEQKVTKAYEERAKLIEKFTKAESDQRAKLVKDNERLYDEDMANLTKQRTEALTSLEDQLMTEEERILDSYEKRKKIIAETSVDQEQYDRLSDRITADRDKGLLELQEAKQKEREALYEGLLTEEQITIASYEKRRKAILDSTAVTEMERQELLTKLATAHANELRTIQIAPYLAVTESASKMFEGLGETIKNFGGEQSEAYHALFAVSKAFSVAQGTLSVATGMANALSLTWPQNLVAMMAVAAQGASLMAQITSTNFAGAYDAGGKIPAGKFGLVGERGPELVSGPANVVGREQTAGMLGGSGQPIRIVNAYDSSHVADFMSSSAGEKVIINVVKKHATTIRNLV